MMAAAHKMARIIYHLVTRHVLYDDAVLFREQHRGPKAPRSLGERPEGSRRQVEDGLTGQVGRVGAPAPLDHPTRSQVQCTYIRPMAVRRAPSLDWRS